MTVAMVLRNTITAYQFANAKSPLDKWADEPVAKPAPTA
jgi:hypothetical protein